jgi:heat shock protein HslJ
MQYSKFLALIILSLLAACSTPPASNFQNELLGSWHIELIRDLAVIDSSAASLSFDSDGKLSGNASCNRLSSTYIVSGHSVTLGEGAVTRMMCFGALMEQESRVLAAMKEVRTARIENAILYLENKEGVLMFKAAR